METTRDYYEILGVSRDVDERDLKKAYRQLALKYHPDRNDGDPTAEERFKEASEAYEVLSSAEKRRIYDQFGRDGLQGRGMGGGFSDVSDIFSHFNDIFGDFFGGMYNGGGPTGSRRRSRRGPRPGNDLRHDVEITLPEAVLGTKKELTLDLTAPCATCGGNGAKPGTVPKACTRCGGAGQIRVSQGFFVLTTSCPDCHGQGSVIKEQCPQCAGRGRTVEQRTVTLRIPPGVDDGVRMRVQGEGEAGEAGAPAGDLYVYLHVLPHETFERHDRDLHALLGVSFPQAALGDKLPVPTLTDTRELKIPAGSQPGDVLRLRGAGAPGLNGEPPGDICYHLRLVVPRHLSRRQKELLQELAKEEQPEAKESKTGILGRLGQLFEGDKA